MNLANRITISRLFLSILIIIILIFPFDAVGVSVLKLFVNESIVIDVRYLIVGVLFLIASLTDFIDGYIARKYNMVTSFGTMLDAIADKILVNSTLILLATSGFVTPIIPVVIVCRDIFVDAVKMVASHNGKVVSAIKSGKIKTIFMMIGVTLTLFYNMPFELWNIRISDVFLILACVLSIISAAEYYSLNKHLIFKD